MLCFAHKWVDHIAYCNNQPQPYPMLPCLTPGSCSPKKISGSLPGLLPGFCQPGNSRPCCKQAPGQVSWPFCCCHPALGSDQAAHELSTLPCFTYMIKSHLSFTLTRALWDKHAQQQSLPWTHYTIFSGISFPVFFCTNTTACLRICFKLRLNL